MVRKASVTKQANFGFLLLLAATLLFALATPILKLLIEKSTSGWFFHPGAISFCNVLFVGNFCAGLVTFLTFYKKIKWRPIFKLKYKIKLLLLFSCTLAIIYPSFIFIALKTTTVTRIVLLSRFEGIFYAILAYFLLKNKLKMSEIVGYAIIGAGVIVMILSKGIMKLSIGDLLILSASAAYAISEIVSINLLEKINLPTFIFIRNLFSAIIFFIIAYYYFGPNHFMEAFYGNLWIFMLIYAGLIIITGQLMWYQGVTFAKATKLPTNFALLTPFFTILFAYLLLSERPGIYEWAAIGLVAAGLLVPHFDKRKAKIKRPEERSLNMDNCLIGR